MLPVCLRDENPNRLVSLFEMLDFYAREFVGMVDHLSRTAFEARIGLCTQAKLDVFTVELQKLRSHCEAMELVFSVDQIDRIYAAAKHYASAGKGMPYAEVSTLLNELRQRIDDELMRRAFYAVKNDRMEFYALAEIQTPTEKSRRIRLKDVTEVFGSAVVDRLGAACHDLDEACRCFVLRRNTACVFHLMRAVEVCVVKIAKLIGVDDPKPSWGSILERLEKLVLRTKYQDRSAFINQYSAFFERVLPEMQAIQRSWRNRVSHVEDRILPEGEFSDEVAENIMNAVRVFVVELARDLPVVP